MLFADRLVVVRGGGDLGSGAVCALRRAGFPVVVLEIERPLAIRRSVAFATAVTDGQVEIDGVPGALTGSAEAAVALATSGMVAVLVSSDLPRFSPAASVVVDARLAKRTLDTRIDQAPLVIGLGPGFEAGVDCHAVVETLRGHRLGRVIWKGSAAADTGVPGSLGGVTASRVVRAPSAGVIRWSAEIGDVVAAGAPLGSVGDDPIGAPIAGVVRGLIAPGHEAEAGLKIADIDPRSDRAACFEVSDKARLVGAGVLEAVLVSMNRDQG